MPLVPTSTGFKGVGTQRDQYKGIINQLHVQLSDDLEARINVAVVPNDSIFILVGNDLIGGSYAKLARVTQNDLFGLMVL